LFGKNKYVTAKGVVADPIKYMYIFLISINSRVDIAMSVCPSVWTKGSQRW